MKHTNKKINIPTALTILRIVLAAVFMIFVMIPGAWAKANALVIFILAAITDKVDGYLARQTKTVTDLGAFLDPIADKILVNLAFLALTVLGAVPVWVFAVVLVRDLLVNGLRMFAAKNHIVLEASVLGKFKTTFQMVALGVILFGLIVNIGLVTAIGNILLYISLIMTIISGAAYFYSSRKLFSK